MTLLYALVLLIFEKINEKIVKWFIRYRNYRYKKDYYDSYNLQQFVFRFINIFIPLGYTAFYK